MNKLQKCLVAFSIGLVLLVAIYQIARFYIGYVPVASAGECLHLHYGDQQAIVEVIQNSTKRGESLLFSHTNKRYVSFQFHELRGLNARKVACPR